MQRFEHRMKTTKIKLRKKICAHPWCKRLSLLLCLCMLASTAGGLGSVTAFSVAADEKTVTWGNVLDVQPVDSDGVRIWDISKTPRRYVDIPVLINVSDSQSMKITLPLTLSDNVRPGSGSVECNTVGVTGANWTVNKDENNVVLHYSGTGEGGQHGSVAVVYKFGCWNVVSGTEFAVSYTIEKGDKVTGDALKGKIVTGHGVGFDEYFFSWGDSAYSLSAFGGADKYMAYIPKWSQAYDKYFDLKQADFDSNIYIYDVAPFLVKPEGQQPYDISGTVSLDQGGEVIGAVYMMDSIKGSDAPWKKLHVTAASEASDSKKYTFEFKHSDTFEPPNNEKKLINTGRDRQPDRTRG